MQQKDITSSQANIKYIMNNMYAIMQARNFAGFAQEHCSRKC